ncbi:MAG: hypothetical protein KAS30_04000, partial [Candidatus Diapherotrites archaeon]|nr:hypothetical protein [Candidatus Diapherotrites archaeon]
TTNLVMQTGGTAFFPNSDPNEMMSAVNFIDYQEKLTRLIECSQITHKLTTSEHDSPNAHLN